MVDELDLEECWQDVRPLPFIAGTQASSKMQESLDQAYEASTKKLRDVLKEKYEGKTVTVDVMSEIVGTGVSLFLQEWHEGLRQQNLAGLIEIILEGQDLTADEMGQFVRALPYSLLERICKSAVGSATGIHGLMAIEYGRRNRTVIRYDVIQDGTRAYVEFETPANQQVKFYLDESFDLPEEGSDNDESRCSMNERGETGTPE